MNTYVIQTDKVRRSQTVSSQCCKTSLEVHYTCSLINNSRMASSWSVTADNE